MLSVHICPVPRPIPVGETRSCSLKTGGLGLMDAGLVSRRDAGMYAKAAGGEFGLEVRRPGGQEARRGGLRIGGKRRGRKWR